MAEELIVAVSGFPELYRPEKPYRNRGVKELAWSRVSRKTGLPEELCRRKWKGLRDTYLKERRKEAARRSGAEAGTGKRWKFSAILSFLDPFFTPRETSGNMGPWGAEEEMAAESSQDEGEGGGEDPESHTAAAAAAAESDGRAQRKTRRRTEDRWGQIEALLLEALRRPPQPAPPPPSEDELFFQSLLPSLQRLPAQQKEYVKFQIHKLMYEASFKVEDQ